MAISYSWLVLSPVCRINRFLSLGALLISAVSSIASSSCWFIHGYVCFFRLPHTSSAVALSMLLNACHSWSFMFTLSCCFLTGSFFSSLYVPLCYYSIPHFLPLYISSFPLFSHFNVSVFSFSASLFILW